MANKKNLERIDELLGYPRIKIIQRSDMLSFSLDSLLLADFVKIPLKSSVIIDFGTGSAPIPLYLSLKTKQKITGVEIQPEVALLARRNVELNKLEDQIEIIEDDLIALQKYYKPSSVDIITCNPPFFKYKETSHINDSTYKTIARHEVATTLKSIVQTAGYLLKTHGHLVMIYRVDRFMELLECLSGYRFQVKRLRFVHPRGFSKANLVLIDATHNGESGVQIEPPLVIHEGDDYTEEVKNIFHYGRM